MNLTFEQLLQRLGWRDMEVQALNQKIKEKNAEIEKLENRIGELQKIYDDLIKEKIGE